MNNIPEKIYLELAEQSGFKNIKKWTSGEPFEGGTLYIRADIHRDILAALAMAHDFPACEAYRMADAMMEARGGK